MSTVSGMWTEFLRQLRSVTSLQEDQLDDQLRMFAPERETDEEDEHGAGVSCSPAHQL